MKNDFYKRHFSIVNRELQNIKEYFISNKFSKSLGSKNIFVSPASIIMFSKLKALGRWLTYIKNSSGARKSLGVTPHVTFCSFVLLPLLMQIYSFLFIKVISTSLIFVFEMFMFISCKVDNITKRRNNLTVCLSYYLFSATSMVIQKPFSPKKNHLAALYISTSMYWTFSNVISPKLFLFTVQNYGCWNVTKVEFFYVLHSCYMKFYFCYVFHIYVICSIIYLLNSYYKKSIYILMIWIFCCMKIFMIWFSHAIRLVKSGRQFVFKMLYCIIRGLFQYN